MPFNLLLRNDWANCIMNQTWQKCSLFIPHSLGLFQNYDFLVRTHPELWLFGWDSSRIMTFWLGLIQNYYFLVRTHPELWLFGWDSSRIMTFWLRLIQNYDFLVGIHPELYPWSYGSWIYNDLCNQCLSPLMLLFWIPLMGRCTRYNIMWCLSVTYGRSVVFSRYFAFLHQ